MIGQKVKHKSFGMGEIVETTSVGQQLYITVYFHSGETKRFLAPQAFDCGFVEFTSKKSMASLKKAVDEAVSDVPISNTATVPAGGEAAPSAEEPESDLWSETIDTLSDALTQLRAELAGEKATLSVEESSFPNTEQYRKSMETIDALENAEALLVLALDYVDGMR